MVREISFEVVKERPAPVLKEDKIIEQAMPGILWKAPDGKLYGYAPLVSEKYLGTYTILRWSFREKQQAMIDASRFLDERRGLRELNLIDFEIQQMVVCTKKYPPGVELTPEIVGDPDFDVDLGGLLLNACRLVNGPVPEEQRDFLSHSDLTDDIPGSQNTGR